MASLIGRLLAKIENSLAKRALLEPLLLVFLIFLIMILSCLSLSPFLVIARFIIQISYIDQYKDYS